MNNRAQTAAVIGGGITGLSLAFFLLEKGIKPTIYEKHSGLGGLLSAFKIENNYLEKYYHHFFSQDTIAIKLINELGIRKNLYWVYPKMGYFLGGKVHSFTTPFDLLAFNPLKMTERLQLGFFSLLAKKDCDWHNLEKITARDWLIRNLGENVYQKIWEPMLWGKFGAHAAEVPAAWFWARLRARGRSRGFFGLREKLGYLRGSGQLLIDVLSGRIVEMGGEIILNSGQKNLPFPQYDFTVVTTPNAYPLPQISYLGNICVVLKLKNPISEYYWINIADPAVPFCAVVEQTNAFDDPGFNGYKIVYLSNYIDQEDTLWRLSDREIFDIYLEGLKRIKPGFSLAKVVEYFVFREKYAQPLPTLEHSKKIPPFKFGENLYLVSNAQIYPEDRGVNDSIKLARRFADAI